MILQTRVRVAHDGVEVCARFDNDHPMHAFLAGLRDANHRRLPHARELVQHALHILGKYVEPLGGHDHFLLASLDEQPAVGIALADVARVQPSALAENARRCEVWDVGSGIRD